MLGDLTLVSTTGSAAGLSAPPSPKFTGFAGSFDRLPGRRGRPSPGELGRPAGVPFHGRSFHWHQARPRALSNPQ